MQLNASIARQKVFINLTVPKIVPWLSAPAGSLEAVYHGILRQGHISLDERRSIEDVVLLVTFI